MATSLDEAYRKPKNVADQLIRMLDEEAITHPDRLRLIALYILFKQGLINPDIRKLLLHSQLPIQDEQIIYNLELLGARISRNLKDPPPSYSPIFPRKPPPATSTSETLIDDRYVPALKSMLEEHIHGTLDQSLFPYIKPELAPAAPDPMLSSASLRSAKPTWARGKLSAVEPRQRIIVFVAGGATYAEARAAYDIADHSSRDVVLVTSHMLTPRLFLQQLGDLSADRRRLGLPADRPAKRAPAHLFEEETHKPAVHTPATSAVSPPVDRMAAMRLNGGEGRASSSGPIRLDSPGTVSSDGKLRKERERQEKKKHHFFSSKR
jgi:syntaxin-binding protein 1